ncbi:AAA family ATPase [Maribius pontilimi]|uniref:AAA family ATPase n=1 Tax=Palleronia pontilimi TaxID=1964209 RepID=A0A934IES3_9RHOB|nr:AAA family ATPase [Palleronia pontilimi]MBJ3764301.1 AAA family ATPase [Palleronia pontilimi]
MSEQRLRAFLDALDLSEYFDVLAAEQVTLDDLAILSDSDLEGLGLRLGPRRRLMKAAQSELSQPDNVVGERRNLTVLFCDMVGSTEIASRLDPEDLRSHLRAYRQACITAIETESGFVAHRMGDGLMAHFGYPRALEDAAIRAVRAGLEIITRARSLSSVVGPVEVRVGIASGLTVIEETRPGFVANDELATGATLSLAARLQNLAPPGGVVVSDATRRLLRGTFELHPLGRQAVKGFSDEETIWQVTREAHLDPEGTEALPSRGAMIGRHREQAELLSLWQDGLHGQGGAVVVQGEPGIGKSRLLAELRGAAQRDGDIVDLHCSPYRHGAALHPVTEWLSAEFGVESAADPAAALGELPGTTPESLPYLVGALGLSAGPHAPDMDPADRHAATIDAVVALLEASAQRARLLTVEDIQWADAATLDVLDRLAERAKEHPLLLVATARPDAGRLPAAPALRKIALGPLPSDATDALIAAQAGADALPDDVRRTIAERSGGVPFFTEELTQAVLEQPDGDASAVPFTLQDTLMARLDRLDAGKPVAQIGALIGRRFSTDLLIACADLSEDQVRAGLAELEGANLIEKGRQSDHAFRHALLRDTAYGSLLRSRRIALHRRVAETIETRFQALTEAQPETLAYHYSEAGDLETALQYWERAAEQSIAQGAMASAISYFRTALELIGRQPATAARDQQEAALRIRLNMPLTATTGFASDQVEQNLARLAGLFEMSEPGEAALQLLWSRCMSALVRADMVSARTTALQMKRATENSRLPNAYRMPERILGYVAMLEGELDAAEAHFDRVLDGYAPDAHDSILPGHPFDVLAATLAQQTILMALRDRPERVELNHVRALERARALDNSATLFQVLVHLCIARIEMGDFDAVPPLLEELREVVERGELAPLYADLWDGWLKARRGALEDGLTKMAEAQGEGGQYPLWVPSAMLLRATLLRDAGRLDEALALVDDCEAEIERSRHLYLLSEVRRHRAACLHAMGASDSTVAELLQDAADLARRQGATRFERAASEDLAGLTGSGAHGLTPSGMADA